MSTTKTLPPLDFTGGLITYHAPDSESPTCLGYLMHFQGHGVYDAEYGRVPVTPEQADRHNTELDKALLAGLDSNCAIGQGGTFYFVEKPDCPPTVTTFCGTIVADSSTGGVSISGRAPRFGEGERGFPRPPVRTITFTRAGKTYRGRLQRDAQCFNFRRIK